MARASAQILKMWRYVQVYTLAVSVMIVMSACAPSRPEVPAEYKTGQAIYHNFCSGCHDAGDPKYPSLLQSKYAAGKFSDAKIKKVVINGTGEMPPSGGQLTDEKVKELIRYIRYLQANPSLIKD